MQQAKRVRRVAASFAANHLRRAGPLCLLLAIGAAAAAILGAHVVNAWPTRSMPRGLPGPGSLEEAMSYVRTPVVLATTLPSMLLGFRTASNLNPLHGWGPAVRRVAADLFLLAVAGWTAALLAAWGSGEAPGDVIEAVAWSTVLLAWSFHALGLAARISAPVLGGHVAVATWVGFHSLFENLVRWRLFRGSTYHELLAGNLPTWFLASQALSPLAAHRGMLILWREGFRSGLERETLRGAELPDWLGHELMAFLLLLWTAIPLGVAALVWAMRCRAAREAAARPTPKLHEGWRPDDADWQDAWLQRTSR